ncbi:hypothetical protein G6F62_013572 [Rhizopus arrhizus]|nr:hypothetical protein G6F62_013572 [Rhizopus arrhizus]
MPVRNDAPLPEPVAPPAPTSETSAPLNFPAPLTEVTLPGNKVRRCVPNTELTSPRTIAPSGARTTPPCSTLVAARRSEPNAEYGTAGNGAVASPDRPTRSVRVGSNTLTPDTGLRV